MEIHSVIATTTPRYHRPFRHLALFALGALALVASPIAAQEIEANYTVTNDWGSGFVAEIELINQGAAPVSGWTFEFDIDGGVVNLWNGEYSVDATHVAVTNLSWNGELPPGGSTVIGFQASYSGDRPEPSHCIFNGRACELTGDVGNPNPPPSPSDFVVAWGVLNQWTNGYAAAIRVFNNSDEPLNDWTLAFQLRGTMDYAWGVDFTSEGRARTVSGKPGNDSIPAGGFVTFGFIGRHLGPLPEPSACRLQDWDCEFAGVTPPPPPPLEISIASPLERATVGDVVSIVATVSGEDVERVEFRVDGQLIGTDTTSPYSIGWQSDTVSDGPHVLTAQVFNATSEASSAAVNVTVQQPDPPPPGEPGFLSMSGSMMVDSDGDPVRLTGLNWFGFETGNRVVHGLWSRDYRSMLHQVRDLGFNALRLPWSNAILEPGASSNGITFSGADPYDGRAPMNQPLQGKSPLEILDLIVEEAGRQGLKVILDNHSRKPDNFLNEGLWYLPDFPESRWIADWVSLAQRYRNNPTVVAFDLHNEPHNEATWGGDPATDWASAAERAAAQIHAVHPEAILIVGGVQTHDGIAHWWGGNLRGVRNRPLNIEPTKLLYSAHDYGPEVFNQPWFSDPSYPDNLIPLWDATWGYIPQEGLGGVFIGEFGIKEQDAFGGRSLQWIQSLLAYMGGSSSWTFWCLNPNSGDTGGILQDDWKTPHQWKLDLLTPYQAEQFPVQP